MKRAVFLSLFLLTLVVSPAIAQDSSELELTLDPDHPVLAHGADGTWDGRFTDPGAAVFYEGELHLFRNGFAQWPGWVGIAYHTSEDGLSWTGQGEDPVLTTDEVPYADIAALASSVLVQDDGTWLLYFYTWGDQSSEPASWSIGRATASNPSGPWIVDPNPVLLPGSEGEWDSQQVDAPSVVQGEAGYVMYYTGTDANLVQMIGMATSKDGLNWTKYNDPATSETPFAESDPVFKPGEAGAWDDAFVHQPNVIWTDEGWIMSYRSAKPGGRDTGYGLATSQDGIEWHRLDSNPFLDSKTLLRRGMWFSELVQTDDALYFFVELQFGYQNFTDIYTATLSGDVFSQP